MGHVLYPNSICLSLKLHVSSETRESCWWPIRNALNITEMHTFRWLIARYVIFTSICQKCNMYDLLCLESSLPCQARLASGPNSPPRTQQSRSTGAKVTTSARPPTAPGGRESSYPILQTKKQRLRKAGRLLSLGDLIAKPALQRHCHAKPWLGDSSIGPSAPVRP